MFTPDPKSPLPRATRYDVTIDNTATAVSGRKLDRPYAFTFTTPTVRLLRTEWYRLNGRFDQPAIIALRFNQPVRPADVLSHVTARYERHEWEPPTLTPAQRARMGAAEVGRFNAKVAAASAVAASQAPIAFRIAADWDKQRFPAAPDLVVLQTVTAPSPDGWLGWRSTTGCPRSRAAARRARSKAPSSKWSRRCSSTISGA